MSGPASIRNAYIAQGAALAALGVAFVLDHLASRAGDLFFFQAPAAAAAMVLCLWSLKLSITAALTQPWRHPIVIWILVALELNAPAVWIWSMLLHSRNFALGVWVQNICGVGLPGWAPVFTLAGILIVLLLKFRARLRHPKLLAAVVLAPLIGFVLPCLLYLLSVLTWDNSTSLPQELIVKYTFDCYKTSVDRFAAFAQPSNFCHEQLCANGALPVERLEEVILTDPFYYPALQAWWYLRSHEPRDAASLCVDFALGRVVRLDSNAPASEMGRFLALEGNDAELRVVVRELERCTPVFRQYFLAAIGTRSSAVALLKNEVFDHSRFDRDVIDALAGRVQHDGDLPYSYDLVSGGFVAWADLLDAKDDTDRVPPLYSLYTDSSSTEVGTRRLALFVLGVTQKFPRSHTPLPNDPVPATQAELDEAAQSRQLILNRVTGPLLLKALAGRTDVSNLAWRWLTESYPEHAVAVAKQIGDGSVRFRPQLDALAGDYMGQHGPADEIRVLLAKSKSLTFAYLTNMLHAIGTAHRHELLPDLETLSHTASYLGNDILIPLYGVYDTEEAGQHFRMLLNGDTEQKLRCARGYVHIADPALRLSFAQQLSEHPDVRVRRTAWVSLVNVLHPAELSKPQPVLPWIKFLLSLLSNGDIVARRCAVRALGRVFEIRPEHTRDPRAAHPVTSQEDVLVGDDPLPEQQGEHDDLEAVRLEAQHWIQKVEPEAHATQP